MSCGMHTCPSKCHPINDHSKMPCERLVHAPCSAGHPSVRKCKDPQKPCRRCVAAKKEAERKAKEDLEHSISIAALDKEIETQLDILRQVKLAEHDPVRNGSTNAINNG